MPCVPAIRPTGYEDKGREGQTRSGQPGEKPLRNARQASVTAVCSIACRNELSDCNYSGGRV